MKKHGDFMQESATAHTANNSVNVLAEVLVERVIHQGMWPACLPSLNPCVLWGTLKDKVYVNNSNSLQELKKIFGRKFPLFQENNFVMYLETFFQDMRPL
jgi:hypothetical protein